MHYGLLMVSWLSLTGSAWSQVPVTARPQEMVFSETEVELAEAAQFSALTAIFVSMANWTPTRRTMPACWLSSNGWQSLPVRWCPRRRARLGRCTRQRTRTLMEYQWREESCLLAYRSFMVCI